MSKPLRKIAAGPIKTGRTKKPPRQDLSTILAQTQQIQQAQVVQSIPEYAILQTIPGIEPFLTRELIPDLIYMLQQGGVNTIAETLQPEAHQRMLQVFSLLDLANVANEFTPENPISFVTEVYRLGQPILANIVSQANPQDPSSIIFVHPNQDVNRQTQKIELELLLNEPEIEERDDILCVCGSRRVRAIPIQTRRADEPATIFANCVRCKKRWSFSSA